MAYLKDACSVWLKKRASVLAVPADGGAALPHRLRDIAGGFQVSSRIAVGRSVDQVFGVVTVVRESRRAANLQAGVAARIAGRAVCLALRQRGVEAVVEGLLLKD